MGTLKKGHGGFLSSFREDAFWRGFSNVFNINVRFTPRYYGRDPERADYEALRGDWEAIGRDMEHVIRRFEQEHAEGIKAAEAEQKRLFDPDLHDRG